MESVPMEVTTQILSMLPAGSILRCRSVCKTWQNLIDEPQFAALHLSREIENELPGNNKQTRFFLRPVNGREDISIYLVEQQEDSLMFTCRKMPLSFPETLSLDHMRVLIASNGIFCVSDYQGYMTVVCNPFTGHSLKLPELHSQSLLEGYTSLGFGYDICNGVFKAVKILCQSGSSPLEAYVYTLGSNSSWNKLDNPPTLPCRKNGAAVNGHIHWISEDKSSILLFHLASEKFGVIPLPEIGSSWNQLRHFKNLDGCLSILVVNDDHFEIWVMKDHGVSESWTKVVVSRTNSENQEVIYRILPISFWKEGETLLFCNYSRYTYTPLVSYNVESGRYTPLDVNGLSDWQFYVVYPYCGNLLPL